MCCCLTWFEKLFRSLSQDAQGWTVCISVLIITTIRSGITYSYGEFVVPIKNEFPDISITIQNLVGTIHFATSLGFSPLSILAIRFMGNYGYRIAVMLSSLVWALSCAMSSLVDNPNLLFVTYSFIGGIGSSLCYMATTLVIREYFPESHKHHVLATSLMKCGFPFGSIIFNPLNSILIDLYGWRNTYRISGITTLLVGLIGSLFMLPSAANFDVKKEDEFLQFKNSICITFMPSVLRRKPEVLLWNLSNLFCFIGYHMPFINLPFYMSLKDVSATQAGLAMTALSLSEGFSYLCASFIGDYIQGYLISVNIVAAVGLTLLYAIWPFVDTSYFFIVALSCAQGACIGLSFVYQYAASGEITGLSSDSAFAGANLFAGIGTLICPFFSGAIYDIKYDFNNVFVSMSCNYGAELLILLSILLIWFYKRKANKSDYTDIDAVFCQNKLNSETESLNASESLD